MVSITQEKNGSMVAHESPRDINPSLGWKKIRRLTIIFVIAFAALWVVLSIWSEVVYHQSRPESLGDPTSIGYLTRGIKSSMTENQVNAFLSPVDRMVPHLYSDQPPWKGFVNTYAFSYGPELNLLICKKKIPFIRETLEVYYDLAGKPLKMKVLVNRLDWPSSCTEIDLEHQKITKSEQNFWFLK